MSEITGVQLVAGFRIEERDDSTCRVGCDDCGEHIEGNVPLSIRDIWLYEHAAKCPRPRV